MKVSFNIPTSAFLLGFLFMVSIRIFPQLLLQLNNRLIYQQLT